MMVAEKNNLIISTMQTAKRKAILFINKCKQSRRDIERMCFACQYYGDQKMYGGNWLSNLKGCTGIVNRHRNGYEPDN